MPVACQTGDRPVEPSVRGLGASAYAGRHILCVVFNTHKRTPTGITAPLILARWGMVRTSAEDRSADCMPTRGRLGSSLLDARDRNKPKVDQKPVDVGLENHRSDAAARELEQVQRRQHGLLAGRGISE